MGKVSYRPKKNQGKQDAKKQYISKTAVRETASEEKVENSKVKEVIEKISVKDNSSHKKNTDKLESIKIVGDMECAYHIYVEDYVYTYIYQLAAADLAQESSAILVGEIYSDSKEAIVRGIIPINMGKLSEDAEWIDMGVAEEAEVQRKSYFKDQDIIGWLHMQPGYGTMLTMKELREHQNVFEGNGTLCMLVDAINKIETLYVYEDEELKEQSGYCMYYERNEAMQQYMLEHPFTTASKEEMKDTVVNQFREIGKMRKAEYAQRKSLNLTVIAVSIILIALTAVIIKMNESKGYNEAVQMTSATGSLTQDETQNKIIASGNNLEQVWEQNNTDAIGQEEALADNQLEVLQGGTSSDDELAQISPIQGQEDKQSNATKTDEDVAKLEPVTDKEAAQADEYDIYIVEKGDTLADICYKQYGNAKRSLEVAKFNGLSDTNQIYVGEQLKMPK